MDPVIQRCMIFCLQVRRKKSNPSHAINWRKYYQQVQGLGTRNFELILGSKFQGSCRSTICHQVTSTSTIWSIGDKTGLWNYGSLLIVSFGEIQFEFRWPDRRPSRWIVIEACSGRSMPPNMSRTSDAKISVGSCRCRTIWPIVIWPTVILHTGRERERERPTIS